MRWYLGNLEIRFIFSVLSVLNEIILKSYTEHWAFPTGKTNSDCTKKDLQNVMGVITTRAYIHARTACEHANIQTFPGHLTNFIFLLFRPQTTSTTTPSVDRIIIRVLSNHTIYRLSRVLILRQKRIGLLAPLCG